MGGGRPLERKLERRLHAQQKLAEALLDALKRLLVVALKAKHDNGRRVRRARQRKTVLELDAHAVNQDDVFGIVESGSLLQLADQLLVLTFLHLALQLRRIHRRGQGVERCRGILRAGKNLEQPGAGIEAVVKSGPAAVVEEKVAGHFSRKGRAGFAQLLLHERMSRAADRGHAAVLTNPGHQAPRALDVIDDLLTRVCTQDIGGKQDNVCTLMHNTEAACKKNKEGKFLYKIPSGTVLKRGTVVFLLKSDPPMTTSSKKHVTTVYQDFTYTGKGYFKSLGGNQSDYIRVAQYPQSQIYAVYMPNYVKMPTLREGSEGSAVITLQQDLNYCGYKDSKMRSLKVDGKFGSITKSVLKKMQKDQGLKVDGICGPLTWERLLQMSKVRFQVTTKVNLNLRKTPEKKDNKIKVLQKGKTFYCSRWTDEWAYLPDEGGWVMNQYLER